MSDLRHMLETDGFSNVETYIQSGNIILDAVESLDKDEVRSRVVKLINDQYGFSVEAFVLTPGWLREVTDDNPFLDKPGIDKKQLYLAILGGSPSLENVNRLAAYDTSPDQYAIVNSVVYIRYLNGAGRSKLTNNVIEAKLKLPSTSRNWNTTLKLLELSS